MSSTSGLDRPAHPIAAFSARLNRVLDGLADAPAWSLSVQEQRTVLVELARARERLAELYLRVLAAADNADSAGGGGVAGSRGRVRRRRGWRR